MQKWNLRTGSLGCLQFPTALLIKFRCPLNSDHLPNRSNTIIQKIGCSADLQCKTSSAEAMQLFRKLKHNCQKRKTISLAHKRYSSQQMHRSIQRGAVPTTPPFFKAKGQDKAVKQQSSESSEIFWVFLANVSYLSKQNSRKK